MKRQLTRVDLPRPDSPETMSHSTLTNIIKKHRSSFQSINIRLFWFDKVDTDATLLHMIICER